MKNKGENIFTIVLLIVFLYGIYLSWGWHEKARSFPMLLLICGAVVTSLMLLYNFFSSNTPVKSKQKSSLKPAKEKIKPVNEFIMGSWILGYLIVTLVFGFWISIAALPAFFMTLFGRENWKIVSGYTIGIWMSIYIIFHLAMGASLFPGVFNISFSL